MCVILVFQGIVVILMKKNVKSQRTYLVKRVCSNNDMLCNLIWNKLIKEIVDQCCKIE